MEADIRAYANGDVYYPKRYKVRPRIYFIMIKTCLLYTSLGDDVLRGDVGGLGLIGQSDAVAQRVVGHDSHVLVHDISPALDEGVGPGLSRIHIFL